MKWRQRQVCTHYTDLQPPATYLCNTVLTVQHSRRWLYTMVPFVVALLHAASAFTSPVSHDHRATRFRIKPIRTALKPSTFSHRASVFMSTDERSDADGSELYCDPSLMPLFSQVNEQVSKAISVQESSGDLKQAEQMLRSALEVSSRVLYGVSQSRGPSTEFSCVQLLAVSQHLAQALEAQSNLDEAILTLQSGLTATLGPMEGVARSNFSKTMQVLKIRTGAQLRCCLREAGRSAESEPVGRKLVSDCRLWYGEEDSITQTEINNLGVTLKELGKFDEAAALLDEALLRRGSLPQSTPSMLVTRLNRAQILLAQGELPKECDEL